MPEASVHGTTAPLDRLTAAGLLRAEGSRQRTTRRWQAAMVRAAGGLYRADLPFDLRLPIAAALVEVFGPDLPDDELVELIEAMLPIEARELEPELITPG